MRALNFFLISIFCVDSISVLAGPTSTSFRNSIKAESGSTGFANTNSNRSTSVTSSVDVQSGFALNGFEFRMGYDRLKMGYDRYLITDRSGSQTVLSKSFDSNEHMVRFGSSIFIKQSMISLDVSKTAGPTPFPGQSGSLGFSQELFNTGTKILMRVEHSDHRAPESFYIDPDNFAPRVRPNRNLVNKIDFAVEQIVSDSSKLKLEVFVIGKPGTRPKQAGAEIGYAKAVNDVSSFFGKFGVAREKQNEIFYDDRGLFGANWGQIEYRFQPSFRWELSAKIATILETESSRAQFSSRKVGTDSFGIAAKAIFKFGTLGLNALGVRANTGYQSTAYGGNFSWNL